MLFIVTTSATFPSCFYLPGLYPVIELLFICTVVLIFMVLWFISLSLLKSPALVTNFCKKEGIYIFKTKVIMSWLSR